MRHQKLKHKLGVKSAHRAALLANLACALIERKRIRTTLAKAKALRPFVEKVITLAKKAAQTEDPAVKLHYQRLAVSRLRNPAVVTLLFRERAQEFLNRAGGYTRIYKVGTRIGDAAEMALIELIDGSDEGYTKRRKTTKGRKAKAKPVAAEEAAVEEVEETPAAEAVASEEAVVAEDSPAESEEAEASDKPKE